mgnify:FL=1
MPTLTNWTSLFPKVNHGSKLFAAYEPRAKGVLAEVTRVGNGKRAVAAIIQLLTAAQARTVVCVPETKSGALGLIAALESAGFTVYSRPEDVARYAQTADAGITEMEFAIAETGSCVQNDDRVEKRLCSALPPLHIGLLMTEHILETIPDAFRIFSRVFDAGYISIITGPSRTADIERVLTIGMHGPARMIPVFIDSLGGNADGKF